MILVDSNVIIDVMAEESESAWRAWSEAALTSAADTDEVAINPIIYAEVSVRFSSVEELEFKLDGTGLLRLVLPYEAGFLAGKAFLEYRQRGGQRTSPLPDFYIGAHAAFSGLALLTRDTRRYTRYFPSLRLIAPG